MISISDSEPVAIRTFLSQHTEVKVCNLAEQPFSDYAWLLDVSEAVERKYITDLIGSLYSGRLIEQLRGCLDEFQKVYLLVEGVWDLCGEDRIMIYRKTVKDYYIPSTYSPATSFSKLQALLKTLLQFVDIVWSPNQEVTANIILCMSKGVKPETLMDRAVRKQKRMPMWCRDGRVIRLVNIIDRMPERTAKALVAQFGSLGNIFNASEEELKQVSGVGKGLIGNIKEAIWT